MTAELTVVNTIGGTYSTVNPPPDTVGTYTFACPQSGIGGQPNDIDFESSVGGFISSGVQSVIINGTYFQWSAFFGNAPAYSVLSDTRIRVFFNVSAPVFSSQNFYVNVHLNNNTDQFSDPIFGDACQAALTYTPPMSPNAASAGSTITFTGTGFNLVTRVAFTTTTLAVYKDATSFNIVNDTTLQAVVPSSGPGGGTLTVGPILIRTGYVTEPGGGQALFTNDNFFPQGPPITISSFSPSHAAPGATVSIVGTGFSGNSTLNIFFTGYYSATQDIPAPSYTIVDDNHITVTVPEGTGSGVTWDPIATGPFKIVTTGPSGNATSSTFTADTPTATITSFNPTQGLPGAVITITGTNLLFVNAVTFSGVSAMSFTYVDDSTLTAVVPAGAPLAQRGKIVVFSTNGNSFTSADDFTPLSIVAGPISSFVVDPPVTRGAGPLANFNVDNAFTRAAGTIANFNLDAPVTRAASAICNFNLDLPFTRAGGVICNINVDLPFTRAAGPILNHIITLGSAQLFRVKQFNIENGLFGYVPVLDNNQNLTWKAGVLQKLASATNINALNTGTTNLHVVTASQQLIVYTLVIRCTAADSVSSEATIQLEGATAGVLIPAQQITGVTAQDTVWVFAQGGNSTSVISNDTIRLRITAGATANSQTLAADLLGLVL